MTHPPTVNHVTKVASPSRRYVYCDRPRCPACGDVHLRAYHSADNGDGSLTRHTKCKTCGLKFILVME